MTIDTVGLEWALKFHETYERLAPEFGYETRTDTRQFESESKNGQLMIAVCGELIPQAVAAATARATAAQADAATLAGLLREWQDWYLDEWRGQDTPFVSLIKRVEVALAARPVPAAADEPPAVDGAGAE